MTSTLLNIIYHPINSGTTLLEKVKQTTQTTVGKLVRDALFFPDPNKKFPPQVATECQRVLDPNIPNPVYYPNKRAVLQAFQIESKKIAFTFEGEEYLADAQVYRSNTNGAKTHTCIRIGGKNESLAISPIRVMPYLTSFYETNTQDTNLCFIQLSLYGIQKKEADGTFTKWKPAYFREVSERFFALFDKLKRENGSIDTLICHSMGASVLENLQERDPEDVPKTIILDRALPSVQKTTYLLNPAARRIVQWLTTFSGWTGDPEQSLLKFFEKTPSDISERKVVIIEATDDYYFSGKGAFNKDLAVRLRKLGAQAFQHQFSLNPVRFHVRAEHSCPIHYLCNTTDDDIEESFFSIHPGENVALAIVRNIFCDN